MGGIWSTFKELIFMVLQQIEGVVGDWGLAIIVLTILVRLALMPLTIKQTKSMYAMQRIQPQLKELQVKYKDDKEKLQEETLKFYQDNQVNPFGGCLPMLLQMPLLIALYDVLARPDGPMLTYFKEQGITGSFFGIIPNLASKPSGIWSAAMADSGVLGAFVATLPYILLVVLFGLSVWLPQALMPGDKQQKMIGGYMAVVMLFFGWNAPAGVLLYWDVSSLWGVAQQQLMMASLKRSHGDDEIVVEEPKSNKKKTKSKDAK